jgi:HSP20 family protein
LGGINMWEDELWHEMRRIRRAVNNVFGFSDLPRPYVEKEFTNHRRAFADIEEKEDAFVVLVEMPGVKKEDISIEILDDNRLMIKAEKKQEVEKKDEKKERFMYSFQRKYAGFYRTIHLPEAADIENLDSEYKNGVLHITIPKKKDQKKKRIIHVK